MKKIILLILILILMPNSVYANEIMQARVTAYYKHPVTGVIEDSGNNLEIGQGMTQTVIDSKGMLEMQGGKLYATVRLNLANHISNVSLGVQEKGQNSFNSVSYEVTDKTEETMDIRFAIPSKTAIVRASFFVEPMGRDVIFFFDFSNFKTISNTNENEKVQENTQNEIVKENQNANIQTAVDETPVQSIENPSNVINETQNITQNSDVSEITINLQDHLNNASKEIKDSNDELIKENEKAQALSSESIGYNHGLLMKGSEQLNSYYRLQDNKEKSNLNDDSQNGKLKEDEQIQTQEMGEFTKFIIKITIGFIFAIALILFIIAITMIIIAKVLRQINLREEEKLYD